MARGDLVVFEEFSLDVGLGVHNLNTGSMRVAWIDNTAAPALDDTTPTWPSYSANECTGTGYTTGGDALTGVTYTEVSGVSKFDDTVNFTWSQNGAGPTDIYWVILYNDSAASDQAICFIDMGGAISLIDGDISITWHTSGILTITVS
jgi:hypothetical protein